MSWQRAQSHVADHHGIISRNEARALDLTDSSLARRVACGDLIRIAPAVYRHAAWRLTWEGRARAAALSADGLVGFESAAVVWGIDGYRPGPLHLVVPTGRQLRRTAVRIHRSKHFDLADPSERMAIPVTGPARTVLDLAGTVSYRRLTTTVDAVIRQQLTSWDELMRVLVRHSARGRNGCGPLRRLLDEHYGDRVPDSAWNRWVGELLSDAGLPEPVYEFEIWQEKRFLARVDLAYPAQRLAIELDSVSTHHNLDSFVADPRRKNRLTNAGWRVLTFTWPDYADHPTTLVATVREALQF